MVMTSAHSWAHLASAAASAYPRAGADLKCGAEDLHLRSFWWDVVYTRLSLVRPVEFKL